MNTTEEIATTGSDLEEAQALLERMAMPQWAALAVMGPSLLTEQEKVLVRLNMRQHNIKPVKNNYARGSKK